VGWAKRNHARSPSNEWSYTPTRISGRSPLGFDHINILGRYAFTLLETLARGELRPLPDPTASRDDEGLIELSVPLLPDPHYRLSRSRVDSGRRAAAACVDLGEFCAQQENLRRVIDPQ
jgi:hypothetical protein